MTFDTDILGTAVSNGVGATSLPSERTGGKSTNVEYVLETLKDDVLGADIACSPG